MKYLLYIFLFTSTFACTSRPDTDIAKIKLVELNGEPIDLAQYEGKAVFINFWATWCKPCIQEMPTIESVREKLQDENVIFLLASNEEPDQIEKFKKKNSYNFQYVHLENLEALNIQALPTTFIYNPEGKLKFSETGYRIWDEPKNIDLITKIINDHEN
jgi:thiol-disulfide isomerase/thioredoxin